MVDLAFPLANGHGRAVRSPAWRIAIQGQDVTREISPMVLSARYTDHVHGQSDDIAIRVHDAEGRWRGAWHPSKGDSLSLDIGYFGEPLLPCGEFEIDEIEAAGPPDVVTIKALAAGPVQDYRTTRSAAYENQTLREIAEDVAGRHGLTLTGGAGDVRIERATQDREDDLTFLTRIAAAYGRVFTIRSDQLVLFRIEDLEQRESTFSLARARVKSYRMTGRTRRIYQACEVSYDSPETGETIRHIVRAAGVISGNVYKLNARVEDEAQARARAAAALQRLNTKGVTGVIAAEGDPTLVAGQNGQITGFGVYTGTYKITRSLHRLDRRAGYTTSVDIAALTPFPEEEAE